MVSHCRSLNVSGLVAAWLCVVALPAQAQLTFPDKPSREHFFVDEAAMIEAPERAEIDAVAAALLKDEQVGLIVVTIPSLLDYNSGGFSIQQYAQALFDEWGIGSKERNYGMLLLVSRGDREARIELGRAWAGSHDAQSEQIMSQLILPEFRSGRFSEGILAGARGLDAMARGLALPKKKTPWWVPVLFIASLALVVGVIVNLFKTGRKGWGWALIAGLGVMMFFMLRTAARSGGSGGAFGGGFSGGGGASGSW